MDKGIKFDESTDWRGLLNLREWLTGALEAAGAESVGGGVGLGQADVEVRYQGFVYDVSIRPRLQPKDSDNG